MDGEPTPRMNTLPTDAPSVACQVRFGTAVARSRVERKPRSRNSSPERALMDAGVAWAGRASRWPVTMTSSRGAVGAHAAPGRTSATAVASVAAKARRAIEVAPPLALSLDMTFAPILPQSLALSLSRRARNLFFQLN